MKTVQSIIDLLGGLEALKEHPIRLQVAGFMPLVIEHVGAGPRGLPLVSVAHYYEQQGDLMADPDMTFEVADGGAWHPVEFQQASPPVYQRAVWIGDDGKVLIKPKLVADLKRFAKVWDRNLREQGFLKAAQEKASSNNREQEEE